MSLDGRVNIPGGELEYEALCSIKVRACDQLIEEAETWDSQIVEKGEYKEKADSCQRCSCALAVVCSQDWNMCIEVFQVYKSALKCMTT